MFIKLYIRSRAGASRARHKELLIVNIPTPTQSQTLQKLNMLRFKLQTSNAGGEDRLLFKMQGLLKNAPLKNVPIYEISRCNLVNKSSI